MQSSSRLGSGSRDEWPLKMERFKVRTQAVGEVQQDSHASKENAPLKTTTRAITIITSLVI